MHYVDPDRRERVESSWFPSASRVSCATPVRRCCGSPPC